MDQVNQNPDSDEFQFTQVYPPCKGAVLGFPHSIARPSVATLGVASQYLTKIFFSRLSVNGPAGSITVKVSWFFESASTGVYLLGIAICDSETSYTAKIEQAVFYLATFQPPPLFRACSVSWTSDRPLLCLRHVDSVQAGCVQGCGI